jgi:hypothetical protein
MAGLVPAIHVLQYLRMAGGYVYFMTNKPNGILYVGVTSDLVRRVFEHRSGFHEAIRIEEARLFRAIRDYPGCDPTGTQRQALATRVEGSLDRGNQSGLERSLRDHFEVRRGWPGQARP